ncbi:MAG: hypothetical protein Q8830_02930, partial [Candidatus Phytoplasma australasiaticum]|nr:hypothetical protein [Candidatus Phytoplasma australasiaticum]
GTNIQKLSDKELVDALVTSSIKELTSLTPINTNKKLQDGGSISFLTNRFSNLQDEDTATPREGTFGMVGT